MAAWACSLLRCYAHWHARCYACWRHRRHGSAPGGHGSATGSSWSSPSQVAQLQMGANFAAVRAEFEMTASSCTNPPPPPPPPPSGANMARRSRATVSAGGERTGAIDRGGIFGASAHAQWGGHGWAGRRSCAQGHRPRSAGLAFPCATVTAAPGRPPRHPPTVACRARARRRTAAVPRHPSLSTRPDDVHRA